MHFNIKYSKMKNTKCPQVFLTLIFLNSLFKTMLKCKPEATFKFTTLLNYSKCTVI